MKKAIFIIEDCPKAYMGYASSIKWKCWEMPYFEFAEAKRIAEDFVYDEHPTSYDEGTDEFKIWDEGFGNYNIIQGQDFKTEEGIKHLYPIGAGNWLWSIMTESELYYLAEGIEDFMWEYDTYEYWNCFGLEWNRESIIEEIKNQLKDLATLKQVYEIWQNEELTTEAKFEQLGKELRM